MGSYVSWGMAVGLIVGASSSLAQPSTMASAVDSLHRAARGLTSANGQSVFSAPDTRDFDVGDGYVARRLGPEHLSMSFWPIEPHGVVKGAPAADADLFLDPLRLQGADGVDRLLLHAPDPVSLGSSISHWDPSASPNLLMEPNINADLAFSEVDVTEELLFDLGWQPGSAFFTVTSLDPQGVGLTDPRPFAGAPGNSATTLGEARRNLINRMLFEWGSRLESAVSIDVMVTYAELFCDPLQGAALAGASTVLAFRDGTGLPQSNTWYHSALTEALAGQNFSGSPLDGSGDIIVIVNTSIDEECLGPGSGFYYGLDGAVPPALINFAPVFLHEVGHGLGFANFTNEDSGELLGGLPGIFDHFTYDLDAGKHWDGMTNEERQASATNFRRVSWVGPNATREASLLLDNGVHRMLVAGDPAIAGEYVAEGATFGPPLDPIGVQGPLACAIDDPASTDFVDACEPLTVDLNNQVAVARRGSCTFVEKAMNAEAAGASAIVIVNNQSNEANLLGGDLNADVGIPAVSVGRVRGEALLNALCRNDVFGDGFEAGMIMIGGAE